MSLLHPNCCARIRLLLSLTCLLVLTISTRAQVVISGTITDQQTGEALVAASIVNMSSLNGTVSNEYGFYSFRSPEKEVTLNYSYVGYKTETVALSLTRDTIINIALVPGKAIEEVTVHGDTDKNTLNSPLMSVHNLNTQHIQKMPMLLGEADLVKALQYLPGVSSGIEGTSGIYVRGGGADQNLILLDGVPVYNVNHLFGFFSVFNGDAVNNATLYKSGFPARYGGRLSSVIDVQLKEGNMNEFHGSASVGLISSKLMLEGPIKKEKTSFMISGRRTYIDILSYPVQYLINKVEKSDSYLGYYFYDLNAKINHRFSQRSRLFFSTYLGKDEAYITDYSSAVDPVNPGKTLRLPDGTGFNWGNRSIALRWNYIWGKQLFSNATVYYENYRFRNFENRERIASIESFPVEIRNDQTQALYTRNYEYYSGIRDLTARFDFSFIPSTNHYIRFGVKGTYHMFEPGVEWERYEWKDIASGYGQGGADTVNAISSTAYIEDDIKIGSRSRTNLGVSATVFQVEGKSYYSVEPRVSSRFRITDRLAAKASFARMSQYVHLLTNSMIGLPTDVWVPTTRNILPEMSWQIAGGFQYNHNASWSGSVELFYKEMDNLVEYAEGADLLLHDINWESKIETGEGQAYGAEFYVQKSLGRLTGSLAYTWSKNFRTFENISFGEPFPYKYDRRHDLAIVCDYDLKEHVTMGVVWVYGSGIHTTVLDQSYLDPLTAIEGPPGEEREFHQGDLVRNFEERNGYQLPAYHRLDVGFNFEKQKRWFTRTWSFGAYNAYSRRNAFYIYATQGKWHDTGEWEKRVFQVAMFPIIPYFRYSIKF